MNTYNKLEPEEDEYGYDNLCKYSIEKCELCDMVFSSRFANIIHSSQHIIIPLIKQKIHTCKKCLYCFTSKSELRIHKQVKHKKKDINDDNEGQLGQEESQIGQEGSQIGQEGSQISYENSAIGSKESQITIEQKKSATGKKKSQKSDISHNDSQNEKDDLLKSIIMKQPIVKIDNIANIVVKTLLATKNHEKRSKIQKETNNVVKDNLKIQKGRKNIEISDDNTQKKTKTNEKESFNTKKVTKQKSQTESIYSRLQTSQNNITEELIPNKILIGGKRKNSPDKTDYNESKRDRKSTRKDERDRHSEAKLNNGIHINDLTGNSTNGQTFIYRHISPDVISIKSDSSDEPKSENIKTSQSKTGQFEFTYDEKETVPLNDQSKNIQQRDQSKNVQPKDQSKKVQQKDLSKNVSQRNQSINIPFVITDSDNELEANIDELLLLNNITSPVKKSNFRSKIQFEDDENIKLLDLERELSYLSYEFKSVHYDDLMEPEMSECQRCHMIFMNRLALYKHEATHMRFRRTRKHYFCKYCENYYYGNHYSQKKHYEQIHKTSVDKKKVFSCPVCKLQYYKLKEHYKKYHRNLYCKDCNTCFGTVQVFNQHICTKNLERSVFVDSKQTEKNYDLLLVCELCLSFIKTTGNFKYEVVGEKCEIGTRQKCFYCTKEFFDVKIVKRVNFMTTIKSLNLKNNDGKGFEGKKKGQGSNAAKLIMIRKRLKAMKK